LSNRKRRPFQKVLRVIAVMSYIAAVGCGIAAFTLGESTQNPLVASFMASVVFFVGVGIVLHVIGTVDLPDLRIGR